MDSPGGGQHFLRWGKRRNTFVTKAELIIHVQAGPSGVPLILQHEAPEFVMLTSLKSFLTPAENPSKKTKQNKRCQVSERRGRS